MKRTLPCTYLQSSDHLFPFVTYPLITCPIQTYNASKLLKTLHPSGETDKAQFYDDCGKKEASLPVYMTSGSAAMDLSLPELIPLKDRQLCVIDSEIRLRHKFNNIYFTLHLRSSIALQGCTLIGGIIDGDFQNNIQVILQGPLLTYPPDNRIIQIIVHEVFPLYARSLITTSRDGGFGSTNKYRRDQKKIIHDEEDLHDDGQDPICTCAFEPLFHYISNCNVPVHNLYDLSDYYSNHKDRLKLLHITKKAMTYNLHPQMPALAVELFRMNLPNKKFHPCCGFRHNDDLPCFDFVELNQLMRNKNDEFLSFNLDLRHKGRNSTTTMILDNLSIYFQTMAPVSYKTGVKFNKFLATDRALMSIPYRSSPLTRCPWIQADRTHINQYSDDDVIDDLHSNEPDSMESPLFWDKELHEAPKTGAGSTTDMISPKKLQNDTNFNIEVTKALSTLSSKSSPK